MKPITIQEYIAGTTQEPVPSTTPSKFIIGGHTPLEPARNELEEKIGVKLPGDKAEIIENEFVNNPQRAMNVLRANTAGPEILQKAHDAIRIHETLTGDKAFFRPQSEKPSRPSTVRPTKPFVPKKWQND